MTCIEDASKSIILYYLRLKSLRQLSFEIVILTSGLKSAGRPGMRPAPAAPSPESAEKSMWYWSPSTSKMKLVSKKCHKLNLSVSNSNLFHLAWRQRGNMAQNNCAPMLSMLWLAFLAGNSKVVEVEQEATVLSC